MVEIILLMLKCRKDSFKIVEITTASCDDNYEFFFIINITH